MTNSEKRKAHFVRALAEYFCGDQARMSILLEMRRPEALAWAKLRGATPLSGWASVEQAEQQLAEWLGIPLAPRPPAPKDPQ